MQLPPYVRSAASLTFSEAVETIEANLEPNLSIELELKNDIFIKCGVRCMYTAADTPRCSAQLYRH